MGRIKKKAFRYIITFITGIIIGILIGVMVLNALISYRIDKYHEEIQYLKTTIEDKDIKLKKLEESLNKWRMVLKDIKIHLEFQGSEIDEIELTKHIKDKYRNLLGKEVKNIDVDMVGEVVNNRIMKLGKKEYKLFVKKIFITDILELWIEAKLTE